MACQFEELKREKERKERPAATGRGHGRPAATGSRPWTQPTVMAAIWTGLFWTCMATVHRHMRRCITSTATRLVACSTCTSALVPSTRTIKSTTVYCACLADCVYIPSSRRISRFMPICRQSAQGIAASIIICGCIAAGGASAHTGCDVGKPTHAGGGRPECSRCYQGMRR